MNTAANTVNELFRMAGFETRIAGGAVRDSLLGLKPKDIDLCTNARPDDMMLFSGVEGIEVVPTGLQHGTVTFVVNGEAIEVTTLRIDRETDGRHAQVEFTNDWREDAARRDLTINAMMMSFNGEVHDWFGGEQDLDERCIRFVGDPNRRVQEDFLRILRFFRFGNKFSTVPHWNPLGLEACKRHREGLKDISVERIWSEFSQIVSGPNAIKILFAMESACILKTLDVPINRHALTQWNTTDAVTAMAAMVHSAEAGDELAERWKMSRGESDKLAWLTRNAADSERTAQDMLVNGVAPSWVWASTVMHRRPDVWQAVKDFDVPEFPVRGQDLLDAGMRPGPKVGVAMRDMRERWVESRFTATRDELMEGIQNES